MLPDRKSNFHPPLETPSGYLVFPAQIVHRINERLRKKNGYLLAKRMTDLIIAIPVVCLILSWLVPLLYICICLDSPGPLFFIQKRVGRGGKLFRCLKFRTMIVNSDQDTLPADENDVRITRIGKFLRRCNLDELPQFFNVLTGSMSLVGPRPHMLSDCARFAALQPGYKLRNMVKPGITGWAQVKGYHGPAVSTGSIILRYFWDIQYLQHMTILLDYRILLQTLFRYIKPGGSQKEISAPSSSATSAAPPLLKA